jgi:acetyl-CoA acetyltransferase
MKDVYIVGIYATPVSKYIDVTFNELTRRAYVGALKDAGFENGDEIDACYFSNYMADFHDQNMCRGNNFCIPLINDGLMKRHMPIFNHENGCASGTVAVNSAWKHILAGQSEMAVAVGVEKMYHPEKSNQETLTAMAGAESLEHRDEWVKLLKNAGEAIDQPFSFGPGRSVAMDFYSLLAKEHMNKYGLTQLQLAHAAAKNHQNSLANPRSQYHFDMTVDDVMSDREVSYPLTRSMCAPIGDGAAAAILCSADHLKTLPQSVQDRAIKIKASAVMGGVFHRQHQEDRVEKSVAKQAYKAAGISPKDVDLVELHDATSFAEVHVIEDLQLCKPGQGGAYTAEGATKIDGEVAVNPSGGLVARGHPIGATGIMMINELAIQLRGEAGVNQVKDARIALQENGGGLIGLDKAICAVTILEGNS